VTYEGGRAQRLKINTPVALAQSAGDRGCGAVLRGEGRCPRSELVKRLHHSFSAESSQPIVHLSGGLRLTDRDLSFKEDVTGVEGQDHALHAHPRRSVPGENRRLDGRRTAMPREQRGVDVERRQAGDGEHLLVEDLAIARDDEHIRGELSECCGERASARRLGLEHRHPGTVSELCDLSARDRASTTARAVGLCHDTGEVVSAPDESLEYGGAERGRPHEDDA
jgi:hypothetical protein